MFWFDWHVVNTKLWGQWYSGMQLQFSHTHLGIHMEALVVLERPVSEEIRSSLVYILLITRGEEDRLIGKVLVPQTANINALLPGTQCRVVVGHVLVIQLVFAVGSAPEVPGSVDSIGAQVVLREVRPLEILEPLHADPRPAGVQSHVGEDPDAQVDYNEPTLQPHLRKYLH